MIVIMAGLPASGKTTLCRELAAKLDGIVLSKDAVRVALFAPSDIEYSTEQDDFCMKLILDTTAYMLGKNPTRIVFIDGRTFSKAYQLEQVISAALKLEQSWKIIECECSEETARTRMSNQKDHPAANRTNALYEELRKNFQPILHPKTTIDTGHSLEKSIARALEALGFRQ